MEYVSGEEFSRISIELLAGLAERTAFDTEVINQLLRLVEAANRLPAVDPSSALPAPDVPEEAGHAPIADGLSKWLPQDLYWSLADPLAVAGPDAGEFIAGSITDDLLDVARDLRRGLALFESGNVGDAVWEWRFSYWSHWRRHALDAIWALSHVDPS